MEFDLVVAPGADPNSIGLSFAGATDLRLDSEGNLIIAVPDGQTRLRRPDLYQTMGGKRKPVWGAFQIRKGHQVTFDVGPYDRSETLVIDPVWTNPFRFSGTPAKLAIDDEGAVYVTGTNISQRNPAAKRLPSGNFTTPGVLVAKMNAALTALEYVVILGGGGENPDIGLDIAVDHDKYVSVTGRAGSKGFPTRTAMQPNCALGSLGSCYDAFISRLDPAGDLVFSTYSGTSGNEEGRTVATDSAGNTYVAIGDQSSSSNVSILKFNPDGALIFRTAMGGSSADFPDGITVDDRGNIYVVGTTMSSNFPVIKRSPASDRRRNAYSSPEPADLFRLMRSSSNWTPIVRRCFRHISAAAAMTMASMWQWIRNRTS